MGYFAGSDADEMKVWCGYFDALANGYDPGLFWYMAAFPAALIQVYDLVLPVDPDQARIYICRLGVIAGALLTATISVTIRWIRFGGASCPRRFAGQGIRID
jgi:hypothetical protein